MSWYRAGTVTVTNGSAVVLGSGTSWIERVIPGSIFLAPDERLYEVLAVQAAGQVLLVSPYLGPDAAGAAYAMAPTQGYLTELAAKVTELLGTFGDLRTDYVEGALQGRSLRVRGTLASSAELPLVGNEIADGFVVAGRMWMWSGPGFGWVDSGPWQGIQGDPGDVNPATLAAAEQAEAAALAATTARTQAQEHASAAGTAAGEAQDARDAAAISADLAAGAAGDAAELADLAEQHAQAADAAADDAEAARDAAVAARDAAAGSQGAAAGAASAAEDAQGAAATSAGQAAADALLAVDARNQAQGHANAAGTAAAEAQGARTDALAAQTAAEAAQAAAEAARDQAAEIASGDLLASTAPAPLGVAAAGTAGTASRSDHVHAMPSKADIGLGNVDNTSDAAKPISTAQQAALDLKLDADQLGATVAPLVGGLVPSVHLPSYVDDVVEVASYTALPGTGEPGKIYVTTDTNQTYRWGGSGYAEIVASPGTSDAVPEGAANLFFTAARARSAAVADEINEDVTDVAPSQAAVHAALADYVKLTGSQTLQDKTLAGTVEVSGSYRSVEVAMAALSVDCSQGNAFTKSIGANSTFTFDNVPAGRVYSFVLELTHTGGTVTWPSAVKWPENTAPTLTTGRTHLFVFVTRDGGTRWRGAALPNYVT